MKNMILAILLLAVTGRAAVPPSGKLDMKTIQVNFREGELDAAKTLLESFLRLQGGSATRDEKIFAYKYLGVIYAVDSASEPKAESYFYQLLHLAPNIELADMYVSKSIQGIFDKVKGEFLHTQEYRDHFDAFGNPRNPEKRPPLASPAKKSAVVSEPYNNAWIWWSAGAVATVGAGVAVWMMESNGTSSNANHITGRL